jgi:hypothetical protein
MTVFRIRDCVKDAGVGKHIQLTAPANSLYNHALPATAEFKKNLKRNFLNAGL